jgi:hypothetical protein
MMLIGFSSFGDTAEKTKNPPASEILAVGRKNSRRNEIPRCLASPRQKTHPYNTHCNDSLVRSSAGKFARHDRTGNFRGLQARDLNA